MAFSDLPLIDHLKSFYGNADMEDGQLQAVADLWFLKATPRERQDTLVAIKQTLDQESGSASLRQMVPLVQLQRRLTAVEQNLKRLGK
jgi:hypothetical protein